MRKLVTFIFVSSQAQQLIKKSTANTALQILFKLIIHSVLQARGRSAQEHKAVQQHSSTVSTRASILSPDLPCTVQSVTSRPLHLKAEFSLKMNCRGGKVYKNPSSGIIYSSKEWSSILN